MITVGFVIEDPGSGVRVIVKETEAETGGTGWLLEHHFPAGARPNVPEHLHTTWTETFTIVSGEAYYVLGKVRKKALTGEVIVMPPGVPHVHPWNAGRSELVYTQRDDFHGVDTSAVQEVIGVFATRAGLMRDGLCNAKGQPKDPLQLAVTLKTLVAHGGFDAGVSMFAQKFIAATAGNLAHLLGYRPVIPKYLDT